MMPTLDQVLELHHGLAARLREPDGAEQELLARGWRRHPAGGWCLYSARRSLELALVHEALVDLRRWLKAAGWRWLPDGSTIRYPRRAGLVQAARVEHFIRRRRMETAA